MSLLAHKLVPSIKVAVVSVLANSTQEEQAVVVGALNTLASAPDPAAATAVAGAMLDVAEVCASLHCWMPPVPPRFLKS